MKALYLSYFYISLLMLFINLNKPRLIDKKIIIPYWTFFILIVLLHFSPSKAAFLLSVNVVQPPAVCMLFITLTHFIAEQQKSKLKNSEVYNDQMKYMATRMSTIVFQRVVYILAFLLITMIILGA